MDIPLLLPPLLDEEEDEEEEEKNDGDGDDMENIDEAVITRNVSSTGGTAPGEAEMHRWREKRSMFSQANRRWILKLTIHAEIEASSVSRNRRHERSSNVRAGMCGIR